MSKLKCNECSLLPKILASFPVEGSVVATFVLISFSVGKWRKQMMNSNLLNWLFQQIFVCIFCCCCCICFDWNGFEKWVALAQTNKQNIKQINKHLHGRWNFIVSIREANTISIILSHWIWLRIAVVERTHSTIFMENNNKVWIIILGL